MTRRHTRPHVDIFCELCHCTHQGGKHLPLCERIMLEVTIYGGLPIRRGDVYTLALETTGSRKAADLFAFSKPAVTDTPYTMEELWALGF